MIHAADAAVIVVAAVAVIAAVIAAGMTVLTVTVTGGAVADSILTFGLPPGGPIFKTCFVRGF